MAKNWTEEEQQHIRQNFLTQTYGELAEHFGVTTKAMESKIRRMGLKKQEMLAETMVPVDVEPVVQYEQPSFPEEPGPTPIASIHKLQRRVEVFEESKEERSERLKITKEAAETEKVRREEARARGDIGKAIKNFEAGLKSLLAGKHSAAAEKFQKVIAAQPDDVGLVMRAGQYLAAAETSDDAPKLKTAEDLYNHGVVLMNDGALEEALEVFEQAAKKAPKDDRITYVQAVALAISGDEDGALEALTKAIGANDVNRIYASNDTDFASLGDSEAFRELTAPPATDADADAD